MSKYSNAILPVLLLMLLPVAVATAAEDEWEFTVAPLYLWAKNIEGSAGLGPADAPLALDFRDDILENLDAAISLHFEAKYNQLTFFSEYNFARLKPSAEGSRGPIKARAEVEFEDIMWELGAAYSFYNSERVRWEFIFGLRHMDQSLDVELDLQGPGLGDRPGKLPKKIGGGDDWSHGFGGLRFTTKLSDKWSFRGRGDLGYQGSDNQGTHLSANFDYRFRDWGSFFAGYRYLDLDYDNGANDTSRYAFDGNQQGPLIGLAFYW